MTDQNQSMAGPAPTEASAKKDREYMDVSFSEMWAFKNCRQRWHYSYREKITPKIDLPPLFLGSVYHETLHQYYRARGTSEPWDKDAMVEFYLSESVTRIDKLRESWPNLESHIEILEHQKNLGVAMIQGYYDFSAKKDTFTFEPIGDKEPYETKFIVPVITPSGNPSTKFRFTGRIDGIIKYMGHYWVHEIKTSKMWNDSDVDLLPIDPQCLGYNYAATQYFGIPIAGTIYSVTMKSLLRQRKAETLEGYRARVVKDYAARPDHYYRRHPIYTDKAVVGDFGATLWELCKDMSPAPRIYKSVGKSTCGFKCPFRQLCTATSASHCEDVKSQFYRKKEAKHEELIDSNDN